MMATTANQRIDVGTLRKGDAVLTAEPATFHNREIDYPIDRIVVGQRHRPLGDVTALAESMSNPKVGQLQAIVLLPDGRLVIGNHRVAAARLLGWKTIRATIKELDELDAELAEIDENLRRSELTVLEQADHLLRREEILDARGLRAQPGDNQHNGGGDTVSPPPATTAAIAGDMGLSERSAQRRLQIARNLDPHAKNRIAGTEIANSTSQLLELARMTPAAQCAAVDMVLSGGASSVQHAANLLALDPDVLRSLEATALHDNPSEIAELARLDPERQRKVVSMLMAGSAHSVRHGMALTQEPAKEFAAVPIKKPADYLSIDTVRDALRPVLADQTGTSIWECAAGRNNAMFVACQQHLAPLGRVRQHELYVALYELAEERGINLAGKAINGDGPLPDWAQTDGANATSTPVPAPPQGDSADLLTTPLDGVSDDDSEGEEVEDEMQVVEFASVTRLADIVSDYVRRHFVMDVAALAFLIPGGYALGVLGQSITARRERYQEEDLIAAMGQVATRIAAASTPEDRPAQHQTEAPAIETAGNESGATAPALPAIELPSHASTAVAMEFSRAGRASSNDLVQKHGYGFGFHPKPPYSDGMVDLSHHDRETKIHRKLGVYTTNDEALAAARRDLQERIAATVPPLEAQAAADPVEKEPAVQLATPPVPPDLAAAGWELRGTAYGRYYLVNERTSQSTRSCALAEQTFEVARGLARPQQNGELDAAPDAARSTWAYWEAQGWRLVHDSKANTLAGVHDATTLATPLVISEAGAIHWLISGRQLTETNYRVATKQPPSPADERNARVKVMIGTLTAARDLVAEYEKVTGIYSHSNNLRQAVRPMIEMLERNLTDREAAR